MSRVATTKTISWSRLSGWPAEVALFGLALLAYQGARAVTRGSTPDALANAHRVFDLETSLGINVEARLQGALLGTPWLSALDWVYLLAQQAILAVGIIYVYRASRPVYRTLRTTLLATWLLTLPVYALFPTAPPRLSGLGMLDTVSAGTPIALGSGSTTFFYNPYAAVPSLHAGFAVALGIAVALVARSRLLRIAGVIWGPLVILSTFATGNHFVVDAMAGVAITAVGFGVALGIGRLRRAASRPERTPAAAPPARRPLRPALAPAVPATFVTPEPGRERGPSRRGWRGVHFAHDHGMRDLSGRDACCVARGPGGHRGGLP